MIRIDSQGFVERRSGLLDVSLLLVKPAHIDEGLDKSRTHVQRRPEAGQCLRKPALLLVYQSQAVVGLGEPWIDGQGRLEADRRFVKLTLFQQCGPEITVGDGVVRPMAKGLVISSPSPRPACLAA